MLYNEQLLNAIYDNARMNATVREIAYKSYKAKHTKDIEEANISPLEMVRHSMPISEFKTYYAKYFANIIGKIKDEDYRVYMKDVLLGKEVAEAWKKYNEELKKGFEDSKKEPEDSKEKPESGDDRK